MNMSNYNIHTARSIDANTSLYTLCVIYEVGSSCMCKFLCVIFSLTKTYRRTYMYK